MGLHKLLRKNGHLRNSYKPVQTIRVDYMVLILLKKVLLDVHLVFLNRYDHSLVSVLPRESALTILIYLQLAIRRSKQLARVHNVLLHQGVLGQRNLV